MTKLAEIQEAIQRLSPDEQMALRSWLDGVPEIDDPAFKIALERKQQSVTGQVFSRPYEEVKASVEAALNRARCE